YYYFNGIGTSIDKRKAFELYQKAANLGDSTAQYNLAMIYETGIRIERNINQAIYWYEKSAEQGDQNAQNKIRIQNLDNEFSFWSKPIDQSKPRIAKRNNLRTVDLKIYGKQQVAVSSESSEIKNF
ncbi:hypothetical protein C1645_813041, partial [Glomus cerebriforme]